MKFIFSNNIVMFSKYHEKIGIKCGYKEKIYKFFFNYLYYFILNYFKIINFHNISSIISQRKEKKLKSTNISTFSRDGCNAKPYCRRSAKA